MTTELHPAIASEALTDALERFAAAEQRARIDRDGLLAAETEFEWADAGNDPAKRLEAATAVAASQLLVASSSPAQLDAEGRLLVRSAIEAGMRWYVGHVDFEPPSDDPRVRPEPLKPKDLALSEAIARTRPGRDALRMSFDEWWRDPSRFNYERTLGLLAAASALCRSADEVRALAVASVGV
jgi:hypothetical protein